MSLSYVEFIKWGLAESTIHSQTGHFQLISPDSLEKEEEKILQLGIDNWKEIISKINPHFLFNTLNTMLNLVYKSPEKVETMILNLSDIYRKVLRLPDNEGITIKEEANIIREYLEIEKIRMGSRLDFTLSLDPQIENAQIPHQRL